MRDKVPDILLCQNRVDFRDTIDEIVKDFPFSKVQQQENQKSEFNLYRLQTATSRMNCLNKTQYSSGFKRFNMESNNSLNFNDFRLKTADQTEFNSQSVK